MAAVVAVAGLIPSARAQVLAPGADYPAGSFTYQFTDTNGVPFSGTVNLAPNAFFSFKVYLLQTNASVTPTIAQVGVQGDGVRLNYNGAVAKVPNVTNPSNFIPNPAYDFNTIGGTGTGTDTTNSAFITNGLANPNRPLPFPAAGDGLRILIGQFRIQAQTPVAGNPTSTTIQAVDPFAGVNNQTGPDPAILLDPTDPTAGNSSNGPGAHNIDPGLIPASFIVSTVPEPSTLALGSLAVAGLAAVRRRRQSAAVAV